MSGRVDPRGLAAWRTLMEAQAAILRTLEAELEAERDLPLTWYDVLLHLAEAPEHRLRMQELARRLVITQGGATRLVARMERAGLVARTSCETDGRGTFTVLTPMGHRAFRHAAPVHLRGIREHFVRCLSTEEIDVVRSALEKVLEGARPRSAAP